GLRLRGDLVLGHHVQLPAREAAGQAHVLAALADRLGELVLGHGQVHRVLVLVDDDGLHLGRRHRVDHELRRVVRPQHDVHALAVEFVAHRLHARTAHADAGADRIGAVVVGDDGDLGAVARITRAGLDLDQALADFRHFELEQFHHELGRGAADEQLRATGFAAHVEQVAADAVAGAHDVARDGLVLGDERFGVAAQVDVDVAAFHALDHAGDQFADAVLPRVHHLLALGFAHALHDHLLGALRGDAAEVDVLDLLFDVVADLDAFDFVDRVHQADLAIRRFHHHVVGHHFPAAER